MNTRHILIALLVVTHILVSLAAWVISTFPLQGIYLLVLVVAASQVNLFAIWLALGRRAAPWRVAAFVSVVVAWNWLDAYMRAKDPNIISFLLPQGAALAYVLGVARVLGLQLCETDEEATSIEENHPWQFSLAQLFAWTTSLAICLGLLIVSFQHYRSEDLIFSPTWFELLVTPIASTIGALICLWLALPGLRRQPIVVILVILLYGHALFVYSYDNIERLLLVLQLPLIFGSLWVFKIIGYRLGWERKRNSPSCESS